MFNKIKWAMKINKLYNKIMRIKLIKAIMGLITVLLSYKIIKYFWYFNKVIIYIIGMIYVGINWSDIQFLNEIKLIWDSIKIYILNNLPSNEITKDMIDATKSDIKEVINYKDHTNIDNRIDDDYVYVIADKLPEVKSIRNEMKETMISDGQVKVWPLSDIISDPWMILAIITAISITGTIIVYHYDLTLDQITEYTWSHIKTGFVATVAFITKIVKWILRKNNDPRPPIEPSNPDMPVNPSLNLDSDIKPPIAGPSISTDVLNIEQISINELMSKIDKSHPDTIKLFKKYSDEIDSINDALEDLKKGEITAKTISMSQTGLNELRDIYMRFPMVQSPSPTGSITPKATSPIQSEGLELPEPGFTTPKLESKTMDNTSLPVENPFED